MMTTSNFCIYLVDQYTFTHNALEFLLVNAGFSVHTSVSWQEFRSKYESTEFNAVVINTANLSTENVSLMDIALVNQAHSMVFYRLQGSLITDIAALKPQAFSQRGYPVDSEKLLSAIHDLSEFEATEADQRSEIIQVRKRLRALTASEEVILNLLAQGHTVADIAKQRGTSLNTVQNQRASIVKKMRARSMADVVRMYFLATQNLTPSPLEDDS